MKISKPVLYTIYWGLGIALLGLAYYVFIRLTGFAFPCLIKMMTGFDCPSCGVTRMFMSLFKLDFKAAFHYNPWIFVIWPYAIVEPLYIIYTFYAHKRLPRAHYFVLSGVIVFTIVFGIIRNVI